ncbi:MAG: CBS domain-containing protein [Dehalogenimonas sp.]
MKTEVFVGDVFSLHGTSSVTLDQNESMVNVVKVYAKEPQVKGVFLVDADNRFAGLISRLAIRKWAEFQLIGKWEADGTCSALNDTIKSTLARTLARGDRASFGLKKTDTLRQAFQQMLRLDEDILPVVDEGGNVIGDLSISEILVKALDEDCA